MKPDIVIWILGAVISALFTITWFSIRNWITSTNHKLDELINKMGELTEVLAGHNERLKSIDLRFKEHGNRLNDHSHRIRKLEIESKAKN